MSGPIPAGDAGTRGLNVHEALRQELSSRGYPVANDTISLRRELYVWGSGDRAAAVFEFKATALEAAESMYQGRWTADLPPRFAVLPAAEAGAPEAEFLKQAGYSVLFFEAGSQDILFVELEHALSKIGLPA